MKNKISRRSFLAAAAVSAAALAVTGCDAKTSKKAVTDITVWNYYNGDQLESFNRLVSTFNETIGKAKGIRVSGSSQGTVNDLEANVMDAAEGVETAAELCTVIELGADLLQGYFLARPAIVPGAIAPEAAGIIQELQRRKKD